MNEINESDESGDRNLNETDTHGDNMDSDVDNVSYLTI